MMNITGTMFNYYHVCHRKLWLFANCINMEQESDLVREGKVIHETSYAERSQRYEEVSIGGVKVDFFDARHKVIHEVKKSNKIDAAHEWQLKYYMYVFGENGIEVEKGILEYPLLHRTKDVWLSENDKQQISNMASDIEKIAKSNDCPERQKKAICRNCSYFEFCYANDLIEQS